MTGRHFGAEAAYRAAFAPGDAVAWRLRIRIDDSRATHLSWVIGMTVVQDTPDLVAVFRQHGYPIRIRNAEHGGPAEFRHRPIVRWTDGWREDTWRHRRMLVLKRPRDEHAISLFWDETGELAFWYIDLTSPLRRTPIGFDFVEHGLDVVVKPDLTSWQWKDEDELDFAVERGVYTKVEATELRAEGERAVERLVRERDHFESWRAWRPDAAWPAATLPATWQEQLEDV